MSINRRMYNNYSLFKKKEITDTNTSMDKFHKHNNFYHRNLKEKSIY